MDDSQVHGTIEQLVAEEHELWEREAAGNGTESDRQRLRELKVSLDQCWDLLRQRRALRDDGRDPDAADIRSPEVVEGYEQERRPASTEARRPAPYLRRPRFRCLRGQLLCCGGRGGKHALDPGLDRGRDFFPAVGGHQQVRPLELEVVGLGG